MLYTINSNMVITTSRKPSQITRRLTQFFKHYFNATYINRGKSSVNKIINQTKQNNADLLVIITQTKGNPSSINIYDIKKNTDEALLTLFITTSIPQKKNPINTRENIVLINKTQQLNDLFELFTPYPIKEKITENCIIIEDYENEDKKVSFIDKNGKNTEYKLFIKGYKINNSD